MSIIATIISKYHFRWARSIAELFEYTQKAGTGSGQLAYAKHFYRAVGRAGLRLWTSEVIHRINNRRGYAHRNAMIHIISFFQRLSLPHASMSWVEIERIIMQNGFLSIYVCCTMRWSISVSRRVSRKCTCLCQCNKKNDFFSCCCTEATVCFDIVD